MIKKPTFVPRLLVPVVVLIISFVIMDGLRMVVWGMAAVVLWLPRAIQPISAGFHDISEMCAV